MTYLKSDVLDVASKYAGEDPELFEHLVRLFNILKKHQYIYPSSPAIRMVARWLGTSLIHMFDELTELGYIKPLTIYTCRTCMSHRVLYGLQPHAEDCVDCGSFTIDSTQCYRVKKDFNEIKNKNIDSGANKC